MEYRLVSAKYWMNYSRILNDYPKIEQHFPIQVEVTTLPRGVSRVDSEVYITINNLKELDLLREITGCELIMGIGEIMIYDDYIE